MTPDELNPPMNARGLNRIFTIAPIVCSMIALALVLGNLAAGVPRQADEGTAAHLFQLLIAIQLPFLIAVIASADWRQPARLILVLGLQALAGAVALVSLAWSGY